MIGYMLENGRIVDAKFEAVRQEAKSLGLTKTETESLILHCRDSYTQMYKCSVDGLIAYAYMWLDRIRETGRNPFKLL